MKKLKQIPKFKSEDEEREFWATHDTTDYIDWTKSIKNPEFPNLKPSTVKITLRMAKPMLYNLKMLANKKDVPYQSLMKVFLAERIQQEFSS